MIGRGQGETFVACDVAALLSHTRELVSLEDGDLAALQRSQFTITGVDGSDVVRVSM